MSRKMTPPGYSSTISVPFASVNLCSYSRWKNPKTRVAHSMAMTAVGSATDVGPVDRNTAGGGTGAVAIKKHVGGGVDVFRGPRETSLDDDPHLAS